MNMPARPAFTPRKKTLLNDYRQPHPVSTAPVDGAKYPAQLMWEQANNGKLLLKVNDGVYKEGAKNNHKEVEMDYSHRGMLFEAILQATEDSNFGSKQIAVQWKQFVHGAGGGRMSEQPVLQVFLTVMRDKNGCIILGYSKGDYKLQFKFKGPRDTVVYIKNDAGEREEDHGLMSRWTARAWVNFHRPLLDEMDVSTWEPVKPKEPAGGTTAPSRPSNVQSGDNYDDDIDF